MKSINAHTKIAHLIKAHPDALETIVALAPKFDKLRNPVLRKLLAGRTSISMASKIAGCSVEDFYRVLKPLGFEIEETRSPDAQLKKEFPQFLLDLKKSQIHEFDVRSILEAGGDPLSAILAKIDALPSGDALKVINSFEPVPLIKILEKQNFEIYPDIISPNLVETYFFKKSADKLIKVTSAKDMAGDFENILQMYQEKLVTVDVRELEMPQPMHTILGALENLPAGFALFVYHKRIPVFLLPELADQNFEYRIKEISEGEVHLLIYKS